MLSAYIMAARMARITFIIVGYCGNLVSKTVKNLVSADSFNKQYQSVTPHNSFIFSKNSAIATFLGASKR